MVLFERVGSTNDAALALAARGAPEGTLVIAESQSAGRGRRGRAWHSPPAGNLYCSLVLRPTRPQRLWPELSWVVAGAVAEAVAAAGARAVALKAPNDVLAGGRKLAGVLLETRSAAGTQAALVAGIGLNAGEFPRDLPGGLRLPATSLAAEIGGPVERGPLLAAICGALEICYAAWTAQGAAALLDRLAAAGVGFRGLAGAGEGAGLAPGAGDAEG